MLSTEDHISPARKTWGKIIVWGSAGIFALVMVLLLLGANNAIPEIWESWRPALYAFMLWAVCLCVAQVLVHGEQGKRSLFVLPAALFVIAMVVFPLIFGVTIALSDWNLSSPDGRKFNGLTIFARCGAIRFSGTPSRIWSGTF